MLDEFTKPKTGYSLKSTVAYSTIIFLVSNILVLYIFIYNYKMHIINEVEINIKEYEEVDLSHLCKMFECSYIENSNTLYKNKNYNTVYKTVNLERTNERVDKKFRIIPDVYITNGLDILIEIKINDIYGSNYDGFIVTTSRYILDIIGNVYYIMFTLMLTTNLILLLWNIRNLKEFQSNQLVMFQHQGYYESMMMLTENIHHELNTPLSIVNNRMNKLKGRMLEVYDAIPSKEICRIDDSLKDFEMIKAAMIQVGDLLEKLRPFKNVKNQTNRDVETILQTSCDMMSVQQHEQVNYNIDEELSNYKIDSEFMTNGELTAIILNFLKNSIDANACNISFKFKGCIDNNLKILIVDDGNGIPGNMQENIFKKNTTSKSGDRGNGLYFNKSIINNSEGNLALSYSSNRGTIFELTVKANYINEENNNA